VKVGLSELVFFFYFFFLLHLYRQGDLDMFVFLHCFFLSGVVEWKVWVLCEFLYIYIVRSGVVGLVGLGRFCFDCDHLFTTSLFCYFILLWH